MKPDKFDKDVIRDYIISKCNPYEDPIPDIPAELIKHITNVYTDFHDIFIKNPNTIDNSSIDEIITEYFAIYHSHIAVIIAGSTKDVDWYDRIEKELNKLNIYTKIHIVSAHKNTQELLDLLKKNYPKNNRRIVFIVVAGLSNAMGGIVAANSFFPVLSCPPFRDHHDMQINIWSSIMNPSHVPNMLILSPINVALATQRILS